MGILSGVPEGVPKRPTQTKLANIIQDHCFSQMVYIHTREDKTLDLLFTNSPSPINRVKETSPIGKADHDIVYVEYDIKAKHIQQTQRKFFLYKRVDMDGLRDHLAHYRDSFLPTYHSHISVNDTWVSFKSEALSAIKRYIPKQNIESWSTPDVTGTDSDSSPLMTARCDLLQRKSLTQFNTCPRMPYCCGFHTSLLWLTLSSAF